MKTDLVWITPDAEALIVKMARVSNPKSAERGDNPERLISYLIKHKHWSPFEMVSACFEIETTRDIARQILRHRSFSFQEFSQRYASVDEMPRAPRRPARMKDPKNRQNSIPSDDEKLQAEWFLLHEHVRVTALEGYQWALEKGIAPEVARIVLPEGLTTSRMYMSGTIRSWLHYCGIRTGAETQFEHRILARQIRSTLGIYLPATFAAFSGSSQ